jgi:hypothetical protein
MASNVSLQEHYTACLSASKMPSRLFQKAWDHALHMHEIFRDVPLNAEQRERIETALKNTIHYHGPGCSVNFPPTTPKTHAIAKYLLGQNIPFEEVGLGWKEVYFLLIEKDPLVLKNLRAELRTCLATLPLPKTPKEEFNTKAFVGNILTLLPFTYPQVGSPLAIPTKCSDGRWKLIDYQVEKIIPLTPSLLASPLPAYLLTSSEGPPQLIFLGTTYPSGPGAAATICADFTPGMSVGHAPMLWGIDKIRKAIAGLDDIEVSGVSLGGACGLHLLRMLSPQERTHFKSFNLFRPPGLYWWNWTEEFDAGPEVNIFIQPGDIVSAIGTFPTGTKVSLYKVLPNEDAIANAIKSHAVVNNGEGLIAFLKLPPKVVNSDSGRKALTILHMIFGPIIYLIASAISLLAQLFYFLVYLLDALLPL